jgi:hypothetical protein
VLSVLISAHLPPFFRLAENTLFSHESARRNTNDEIRENSCLSVAEIISAAKKRRIRFFRNAAIKTASWGLFTKHLSHFLIYIQQIEKFSPDTVLGLSRSAKTVFLNRRISRLPHAKYSFCTPPETFRSTDIFCKHYAPWGQKNLVVGQIKLQVGLAKCNPASGCSAPKYLHSFK